MNTAPTATEARAEPAESIPGGADIWFFVLFETLLFTGYFAVYLFWRSRESAQFLSEQADLSLALGIGNTLIMLTSSWSIAHCVQASRAGRFPVALRLASITMALGALFLAAKIVEWHTQLSIGNGLTTSGFFSHYFFLTGIHAVHVLIGFFALGIAIHQLRSPARRHQQIIETCAIYWHTVDFLWVLIFAMIYVVR